MRYGNYMERKSAIVIAIIVTALIPLLFLQWDEPAASLVFYKTLAKVGSLVGTVLLLWQVVLGFRGLSNWLTEDIIWMVELHKKLGLGGALLILLHPVFITFYYLHKFGQNPWLLPRQITFNAFVVVGMFALGILAVIVLTSVLWRNRMAYRTWYFIHLSSYLMIPAVFVHGLAIGSTIRETHLLYAWLGLGGVIVVVWTQRILFRLGLWSSPYRVTKVKPHAPRTVEIFMSPTSQRLVPRIGQFAYVRLGRKGAPRPYTISAYDEQTGSMSITVKAFGKTSTAMQSVRPGDMLAVDGPYGVFSQEALQSLRPVLMVAGGIGITAFRRLIRHLEQTQDCHATLFYGNNTSENICYKEELEQYRHVKIVHVMSEQEDWSGEKGFVTTELMARHVQDDLAECEILICGPPIMIRKLEGELLAINVPTSQIHHELFQE
jgi:predicted ferric reductase